MVKAQCDFDYRINKEGRYHQDGKLTHFKKGDVVPAGIVPRLAYGNPEYIDALDTKKRKEIVDEALKQTNKSIKEKVIEKKEPRYTKEQIKAWNKAKQVEALQGFGLTGPEIKKLTYEKDRVAKLYKLYEEEL